MLIDLTCVLSLIFEALFGLNLLVESGENQSCKQHGGRLTSLLLVVLQCTDLEYLRADSGWDINAERNGRSESQA